MDRKAAVPIDTDVAAHDAQAKIYGRLGGRERVAIAFRLSDSVRRVALSGIRRRHPHYTDSELKQAYARLCLGDALVRAIWPDCPLVEP